MKRGAELIEQAKMSPTGPALGRGPGTMWWLVAKDGRLRKEMLTVDCDGGRALPVFSSEGEAELFVWLEAACQDGWRVRETSAGELVSILCGPCADVRGVVLDPLPDVAKAEKAGHVIMARKRFLDRIVVLGRVTPVPAAR